MQDAQQKEAVAARARGRWGEILSSLCDGLPSSCLDGRSQPCPRCGGHDRFSVFTDFAQTGGALCRHCFSSNNGDGFAFLMWWHGWTFPQAVTAVARYLGMLSEKSSGQKSFAEKWACWSMSAERRFAMLEQWCQRRPGTDVEAAAASGARIGNWPAHLKKQGVVAFRGSLDGGVTTAALLLYPLDRDQFPPYGKLDERKTHLVGGSVGSWIAIGGWQRLRQSRVVVRVEGVPDGLALLPILPPEWAIVTPSTGAGWSSRRSKQLPLDLFADRVCVVVGDADGPGQDGARAFARSVLAEDGASGVLMAQLPYPVSDVHGKDLRDWLVEDERTFRCFLQLLRDFRRQEELTAALFGGDDVDVPSRTFENYTVEYKTLEPKSVPELVAECVDVGNTWPRNVNGRLFVDEDGEIRYLAKPAQLVAWLGYHARVSWSESDGMVNKTEFFEALGQRTTGYVAIENCPHHPEMPDHYYACSEYPSGDGTHLAWLLGQMYPETEADRYLILLLFASVFWGGPAGSRPAFVITADGRGAGKTTLAAIAGALTQGIIDVGARDDVAKIKERLLTPTARDKRIVLLDNIKAHRFSNAGIEALITAAVISGRELYHGESQRPNTVLWVLTMNGVSVSKDVAQRSIVIRLRRPQYSGVWQDQVFAFIEEHRREIICDLMAFLRAGSRDISQFSRWGVWERSVLARQLPSEWTESACAQLLPVQLQDVQELIGERQQQSDVDAQESEDFEELVESKLRDAGYDPRKDRVWITNRLLGAWYKEANGSTSHTRALRAIRQELEEGTMTRLESHRHMTQGRGYVWRGPDCESAEIQWDLEIRMSERRESRRFGQWGYGQPD